MKSENVIRDIEKINIEIADLKSKRVVLQKKLEKIIESEERIKQHRVNYLVDWVNEAVSEFYELEIDILAPTRERITVWGRAIFCHYARNHNKMTYQAIGDMLCKNHATVINALKMHENLLIDYEYQKLFLHVSKKLSDEL